MEKKLDEAPKKAETNPELNKTLTRLEEMRMEGKIRIIFNKFTKRVKNTLNGEEEVNIETRFGYENFKNSRRSTKSPIKI